MKLKKIGKKGEEGGIPWTMLAIIIAVVVMIIGIILIARGDGALSGLFNRIP